MKKNYFLIALLFAMNYAIWLLITAGFHSTEATFVSSVAFAIYSAIVMLLGDRIFAILIKTTSFSPGDTMLNVLSNSCLTVQNSCSNSQRTVRFYCFDYEKPTAFAFGNHAVFVSSSTHHLRQSQQSQLFTQATAQLVSLRGMANLVVVLGTPIIVVAFTFILFGKWIIYVLLQFLKIVIFLFLSVVGIILRLAKSLYSSNHSQSSSPLWLLHLGSLFSADKISDAIYLVGCGAVALLLKLYSLLLIVLVRQFDYSTDRLLVRLWARNDFEHFIGTDFAALIPAQQNLSSRKTKLLCSIVDAHVNSQSRLDKLNAIIEESSTRITIRQSEEIRQPTRIRIHRGVYGGHHED